MVEGDDQAAVEFVFGTLGLLLPVLEGGAPVGHSNLLQEGVKLLEEVSL